MRSWFQDRQAALKPEGSLQLHGVCPEICRLQNPDLPRADRDGAGRDGARRERAPRERRRIGSTWRQSTLPASRQSEENYPGCLPGSANNDDNDNPYLNRRRNATSGWPANDQWFIIGTTAALRFFLDDLFILTHLGTYKPFSFRARYVRDTVTS